MDQRSRVARAIIYFLLLLSFAIYLLIQQRPSLMTFAFTTVHSSACFICLSVQDYTKKSLQGMHI